MKKRFISFAFLPFLLLVSGCNNPVYPDPKTIEPEKIEPTPKPEPEPTPYEPWVPEIIDLDEPVVIDDVLVDDTVYDYSNLSFKTVSGEFNFENNIYTAVESKNMAVNGNSTSPFTHGTFSADFEVPVAGDNGIIFGLSSSYEEDYWEGYGISYYFFFINFEGTIYLGKSNNGDWIECKVGDQIDLDERETPISLKILFYGNKIICFVDNELVMSYRDTNYLTGTGYGFRTGSEGAKVSNIFASSDRVL